MTAAPWRFASMGGVIGLDIGILRGLAKDIGIPRPAKFYEKLKIFEDEALKIFNKKDSKLCTHEKKEKCKIEFGDFLDWACSQCETKKGIRD